MSKRKIIIEPDPILRKKSVTLEKVDNDLRKLMDDMLETMYSAPGIGLAAVQIGVPLRVIVMDISWRNEEGIKEPLYFVNPEITVKTKNLSTYEEGCLSVPDQYAEIDRPEECEINFLDYNGKKSTLNAKGLLATCIQHEMDHLEGILFIDHLSNMKRNMIVKKLIKTRKQSKKERIVA